MKWLRKEPQCRLHLFSLIDQSQQFIKGQLWGYAMKLINGKGLQALVGSFNFDPRSAALNTEMGFVVDSPALAQAIHQAFETKVPQLACEARLGRDGRLEWVDRSQGSDQVLTTEPDSSLLKRGIVKVMSWLPIDWLL